MASTSDRLSVPVRLLDRLFDQVSTGIMAVDDQRRLIVFNSEAEKLVGLSREAVTGITLADARSHTNPILAALGTALTDAMERGKNLRRQVVGIEVGVGFRVFGHTTTPLFSSNGALEGAITVFADLTRVREEERERYEEYSISKVSKAMAWLGHQVKTPLAAIHLYAGLSSRLGGPEIQESLDVIKDQVALAQTRISEALRAFSISAEEPPLRVTDLATVLDLYTSREAKTLPHVGIRVHRPDQPCFVPLAEDDLLLVLSNLVNNAIEAVVEKGSIDIRLEPVEDRVILTVEDTGPGFAGDEPARFFQPFFSSKPRNTGMGLWTVERTVRSARGQVRLSNRGKEGGARVVVELPGLAGDQALRGRRILVAEDEAFLRKLIARELQALGAVVSEAETGIEALSLLVREPPELVVSDISMPGLDGRDLVKRLDASVPVLLISGWERSEADFSELERGNLAFLPKPFELHDLTLAVSYLLWQAGE